MAGESEKDVDVAEKSDIPASADSKSKEGSKKNKQGLLTRIWHAIIGSSKDDFQSRLEKISKEETITLARTRKRAQSSRRVKMNLIILTLALEVFAVGYAIVTARSIENWKKRAFHVFPMFAWPGLMITIYSAYAWCINIWERKDQKTLERLRAERQSKIDELKEKTNYYMTQQLIQRYDTDPAAKAAAATVLASKLGAESGLKLQMEGDKNLHNATGKSNDAELTHSRGLRNRKQPHSQSKLISDTSHQHLDASTLQQMKSELAEYSQPLYVGHYEPGQGGPYASSGGWLPRLAAMLVGEDPAQSYALICGNCHMHNGLTSKEDFPHVTYICPHCRAINGPRNKDATHGSGSNTPNLFSQSAVIDNNAALKSTGQSPRDEMHDGCNISGSIRDREVHTPSVIEECSHTVVAPEDQGR